MTREHGLSDDELATLDALVDRLIPTDENGPGARDAQVGRYLREALSTAYREHVPTYRAGLVWVDELARESFGRRFRDVDERRRDEVVARVEESGDSIVPGFFELLLQHTREGMFGDPRWGGNAGYAGWVLLGYAGPRWTWTEEEQQLDVEPEPSYEARTPDSPSLRA